MILAGDIGGTKTNLALYEYKEGVLKLLAEHQFVSKNYATFSQVLEEFVEICGVNKVSSICLGIAGPIINGVCQTTNLPWHIETQALIEQFQTPKVKLLNDLEATAYGMLYLKEEEFVSLNPNAKSVEANRAVIAAGTGLGEAMLFFDGKEYHPIGSEGGHCDFAPQNSLEDELLLWLRKRHKGHVSVERIISGVGISTIYEFLLERDFADEPDVMLNLSESYDKNAMISECALKEGDALCVESMRIFAEIYGAEAGNLALKSLSLGGVYIGGGIAPKILAFLQDGIFLNAFISKGRFKDMLEKVELKVSLNPQTALLGAVHFAKDKLMNS